MNPENKPTELPKLNLFPSLKMGLIIIGAFFVIFGVWAFFTPIESAAVSEGRVVVNTIRKNIQHLRGGRIAEIFVKEGDTVRKGDPLIQLDISEEKIQYASFMKQYYQLLATKARFESVLSGVSEIIFPDILLREQDSEKVSETIAKEKAHFYTHKKSIEDQIIILDQEIDKQLSLIQTAQEKMKHHNRLLDLLKEEETEVRKLREENLVSKPRLLGIQREMEKAEGDLVSMEGAILEAKKEIAHASAQKEYIVSKSLQEAADQRLETQKRIIELEGKIDLLKDNIDHSLIASPIDGIVIGLRYHTIGGVIKPGDVIMEVVPVNDMLIIEASVSPLDIDIVVPFLKAKVDFLPYVTKRDTPIIDGEVTLVSPDIFTDEKTGRTYYKVFIQIFPEELSKASKIKLYPGMPVQVMIVNDKRTPFEYFFTPIFKSYHRAFRED